MNSTAFFTKIPHYCLKPRHIPLCVSFADKDNSSCKSVYLFDHLYNSRTTYPLLFGIFNLQTTASIVLLLASTKPTSFPSLIMKDFPKFYMTLLFKFTIYTFVYLKLIWKRHLFLFFVN